MPEENKVPQPMRPSQAPRSALGVPVAIVLSALLIAGAIVYSGSNKGSGGTQVGNPKPVTEQVTGKMEIAPVTEKDHIYGNPNAPIMIVEYSDFDCPFCKNFHETMQKIMETYGKDGKVAWVYRQFPLKQLHPNSPKVSAASECVASLGGNDAFWKFANLLIGDRGVNEPTNLTKLPEYAVTAGVDKAKYTACVEAGTFDAKITEDVAAAMKAGARGTPYSVMIVGDQQGVIDGAQPYDVVKKMVDTMLTQLSGDVAE